ncbi:MAG: PEP-CTERM sorting domain-containing protein [Phycisphaerales bacterium]|nr:PEP-CTERM sorting domain-containing protein [Phycisphaerales bacterium]
MSATICGSAFGVNLDSADYFEGTPDLPGNLTFMSFDYTPGPVAFSASPPDFSNIARFDINYLNPTNNPSDPSAGHWFTQMFYGYDDSNNLTLAVDSDYGPYAAQVDLTGQHHYLFTVDQSNGKMWLSVDGSPVAFKATNGITQFDIGGTSSPQPDGTAVTGGDSVPYLFVSDESETSGANAVALGWASWVDVNDHSQGLTGNAVDGVGGEGSYQLQFYQKSGASVSNISFVPEPSLLGLLGVAGLGGLIRRRRAVR